MASEQLPEPWYSFLWDIDRAATSQIVMHCIGGFSLDRLVRFLVLLGNDVEIVVKARPKSRRHARVMVA